MTDMTETSKHHHAAPPLEETPVTYTRVTRCAIVVAAVIGIAVASLLSIAGIGDVGASRSDAQAELLSTD